MSERVKFSRSKGFFEIFERRPGAVKKNMSYCPGCGHGILHKLIAEAIADFGIQDRTTLISPVGCSVFAYYYFDCFGIQVPHGRSAAAATGLTRANPEGIVIGYQGDGDLAAIGFNNFIQAANRGENYCVFFVNNAIYGMTGGQMAPTSLIGQKTTTSPYGRNAANEGFPLKVCEMTAQLEAPVYVERVALTSTANIMKARQAVRKAVKNNIDKKGFSLVEFLSGCPVNLKFDASQMDEFIDKEMTKYFPLGVFKDESTQREPNIRPVPVYDTEKVREAMFPLKIGQGVSDDYRCASKIFDRELRIKIAGFGGQGVLSLGLIIAAMGKQRNFNVSWLPSYGPEMRGGTANCAIIVNREAIGSPIVDSNCDLLIILNKPSLDKYVQELSPSGILLYDSSTIETPPELDGGQSVFSLDATNIAEEFGNLKCANSIMLGALAAILKAKFLDEVDTADIDGLVADALTECFTGKEKIVKMNIEAYQLGLNKMFGNIADV
ncbi:MAG: 2-oxoacid:acceptor oxidoreductase family protein [Victivallaceae bacterium]|nr:2-oxoacid:acceptor oxidoreductase family protein [Victivallaceae bacterium]